MLGRARKDSPDPLKSDDREEVTENTRRPARQRCFLGGSETTWDRGKFPSQSVSRATLVGGGES